MRPMTSVLDAGSRVECLCVFGGCEVGRFPDGKWCAVK